MSDLSLFISGSLLTTDYLVEAITETTEYAAVDVISLRQRLVEIAGPFPRHQRTNESQTEDDFIWPVLGVLGWTEWLRQQNLTVTGRDDVPDGLLFADAEAKAQANAQDDQWRRYSHGIAIVESKRWARPLDRASGRDETAAPSTQMLRYLRRIDDLTRGRLRWGILTNGPRWRLYWAGARSVSEEFLEIDLARALSLDGDDDLFVSDRDRDHWLRVFAVMFSRTAFVKAGPDSRSFHERARAAAAFYEEKVAASLSALVFEQVFPSLATAIAERAPDAPLPEVRDASLVLLYRLLFLLYAEDRDLLPVADRRYDDYALRPLRIDVGKRISDGDALSTSAARIWGHISDLSGILDKGDASVGIPPYNGGLFDADRTPLLDDIRIPDSIMGPALDALSYGRSTGERRYINYRDLSVQQLGSIYERLLEFELVREETGTLAVRPHPFARRNSGSYYTPDELVGLILAETLEPLVDERLAAFRAALEKLDPRDSEDYQRRELRAHDPAEAILSLRICDPAMGSGHFLVSLVDMLADNVLNAMAEAASAGAALLYVSPLLQRIEGIRDTIFRNAKVANWTIHEEQLDDRHIVRRMVLKRCVFGVDKNPMAVELAKVGLWLHTFTVGAPLSFIDHHLHAGDSLFGLWVRDAIDKAAALGGELLWNDALRDAQRTAEAMKTIEALTDVEIAEAHRSAIMYRDVESITGELDSFVSFMHALDWLDLDKAEIALVRLWLDGRFGDPLPIARGRKAPAHGKSKPAELEGFTSIWERARATITETRFLNWQIRFPGVWRNWSSKGLEGGFDAVVGNPPWDRMKLQQVEWFAERRPEIAMAPRASDRLRMIAALRTAHDPLARDYDRAAASAEAATRVARAGGAYPLLSGGDVNIYSLFVERSMTLVRPGGIVGLLTPSGIASDKTAAAFFRGVATGSRLKALYDFENRRTRFDKEPFFPDVDSRFKFNVFVASPTRKFPAAACAFFLQDASELLDPERRFQLTAEDFARFNPNTGTAPVFRTRRDAVLTAGIYRRLPVLVDRVGDITAKAWPVRYMTMFHMTNNSDLFRNVVELQEQEGAWPLDNNRWRSRAGEWVPLYEGKMVQAFDHRAASVVLNHQNLNRPAQPMPTTTEQHSNPAWTVTPQYWVKLDRMIRPDLGWVVGFKEITAPTNARTMIAAILPSVGFGNKIPLLLPTNSVRREWLLVANFNCILFDFVTRQKIQGQTLNLFIIEQLPVIPLEMYAARRFGPKTALEIVQEAVLELTYTAHDMAPFAMALGYVDGNGSVLPPAAWDESRRLHLRAKLDAVYFILYGVFDPEDAATGRDDIRYIYSTFPIVEREETARWGHYRSRDLALAWINALMAGQPDAAVAG